ncbi:MAG: hypothetical protein QNJ47_07940 [Nostocaceae cyanobacterium]|nr:hypothetical protein [Nostocaceae cyanobacterium]
MNKLTPDNNGLFQLGVTEDIILDLDQLTANSSSDASLGYYFVDVYGNYIEGKIILADVSEQNNQTSISIKQEDLPIGAVKLGFFLIEDGARLNPNLSNGDRITFDGNNNLFQDGNALIGSVLFTNKYKVG